MDINNLVKFNSDLERINMTIQDMQGRVYSDDNFYWPEDESEFLVLREFLKQKNIDIKNPSEVGEMLESLRKELSELNIVRMRVVSQEFSREFWAKVFTWLKDNLVKRPFILQREVDPSILGGVILAWKGLYFDLSLHQRLNDYFEKEEINVSE